ncbi:alpha-ketoglutarate-dependent sulfonate dioxygenase [Colletotrichum scovillei]|uniref:Alpha-ketoglutarate-dependent sulfonate dioxygenase n=1 Tax=Colletotrichum scovillei TaxID=1209932 RepID=A0A9P7U9J0_9PEZI|nr:alpha-ketoglutarate-dependent sulfonate dioxygenase [Colletotrichum scovillei]KAG7043104.1 alpha-ketoglutarate-dependent sulfonate dioxygenase [Colletotrichum scovillei]KAG7062551.1 alpha-ketoglutarate-dependent sulfonate dioxygenase [Colletotrichum scovillei]
MWKRKGKSKPAPPPPPEDGLGSTPVSASEVTASPGSALPAASAPPLSHGTDPSDPDPSAPAGIAAGLNLVLPPETPPPSSFPTQDACLAHLRLLTAFNRLKTETGYRDGLWDIWDARADTTTPMKHRETPNVDGSGKNSDNHNHKTGKKAPIGPDTEVGHDLELDILIRLREKRWAIYLGRAVDRYAAWWRSFGPDMLLESDMLVIGSEPSQSSSSSNGGDLAERQGKGQYEAEPETGKSRRHRSRARYEGFPDSKPMVWREEMLPPLDVLLVWHAHMLNPRLYLEDCLRYGHSSLWAAGIPWSIINAAITSASFEYVVSDVCKAHWEANTNLAWYNEDDPDAKDVPCPACSTLFSVPWTTCGLSRDYSGAKQLDIVGQGLADGRLAHACPSCGLLMTHESLRAAKFRDDIQASIRSNHAMPGTILDLGTGLPKPLQYGSDDTSGECPDRLFPTRLARRGLSRHILEMFKPGSKTAPSMMAVRDIMEESFTGKFADPKNLREVMSRPGQENVTAFRLSLDAKRQTRKMMSRYWENSSPFSIDLPGCVMRQATFTEKMCKLNWLHFPTARDIMTGLLEKYDRFVEIIAIASSTEDKVAVPTLDVDLAWHTHQLSPQSYFVFTLAKTGAFVDHNDKVDEDRLSTAFEWTSKTYQEKYGEIYSQCKCWYCETVRVMALPTTKMFGIGKEEKLLETWHAASKANNVPMPPAAESAHVSSHPAVHTNETTAQRTATRPLRSEFRNRLEETHSKARKRASETFKVDSGKRMGPRGEDKMSFWGKDIAVDGPWASVLAAVTTSAMYPAGPGLANMGPGAVGSCATGTCGGATGCGSELLGMCSAGCVGSAWFGGKAGCTGMGEDGFDF